VTRPVLAVACLGVWPVAVGIAEEATRLGGPAGVVLRLVAFAAVLTVPAVMVGRGGGR
jgi:hypothetical protein